MPIRPITSAQNATVKQARALKLKKERQRTGLFVAEGIKTVEEAVKSGAQVETILLEEGLLQQLPWIEDYAKAGEVCLVPEGIVDGVSDTRSPQGIVAVVRRPEPALWESPEALRGNLLVLDEVQDPGNLGTLIRTADAAGCSGVLLSQGCVEPSHPKAVRASMGSFFHLPAVQVEDLVQALCRLKNQGYFVLAGDLLGSDFYARPTNPAKKALIVGNEAHGIRQEVLDAADARYKLPILGRAESLNAAMAAGIMLYDLVREARQI
ncbi:RNA methyltransferase [Christensenellaceae bacterium NSJ-44]|uniref:RNA methyltransferase n=1 Tax=Luoshenia tenuis TaxID=2763654 RepID=A0A926CYU8_9FIRM|nr:RNA methyltransferase [Luoshenia tenuis]MBC8529240.1 RNA methyltransferase [Luoshenia tenuis]